MTEEYKTSDVVSKRLIEELVAIETRYEEVEREYKRRRGEQRKTLRRESVELKEKWHNVKSYLHHHFRPIILDRDGFKCRACGASEDLELARLYEDSLYARTHGYATKSPEERYSEKNMLILCYECHKRFDSLYCRMAWRRGSKAISSVDEAIRILCNKDLFKHSPFVEGQRQKYLEHMQQKMVLTFFKVLRKTVFFYSQKDFREARKYAGMVKREMCSLIKQSLLQTETRLNIEFLREMCQRDSDQNIIELADKIRKSVIEFLEKNISQDAFFKFREELAAQDKALENKLTLSVS